jgi:hypothetical protein
VSKGVAEWFIELDDGELSFIDIPLYANACALHSHKDMLKEKNVCVVPQISKSYILKLNVALNKERVPVVCSGPYCTTWYWSGLIPKTKSPCE